MGRHITVGMDLGDRSHIVVVQDERGDELDCRRLVNTKVWLRRYFQRYRGATVAIEAGTHSPWISRELEAMGCRVYVGNPRKLRLIWDSDDKSDERDARMLAMVCRVERKLLWPIRHRDAKAHDDLEVIKARDMLAQSRTNLTNHVRSVVKARGDRPPGCSGAAFANRIAELVPAALREALLPLIDVIGEITKKIARLDKEIRVLNRDEYAEAQCLQQVAGVGR